MIRLATDVGGTFTDLVAYDETSGKLFSAKSLTTVNDQSEGVMNAIASAEEHQGLNRQAVAFFVHGGTTVINAITERKGVKTALVTTSGFRDVLEIGRGNRPDLYNLKFHSPEPFVPRHLRFEVRERLDAKGCVVQPFQIDDLTPIIAACKEQGVESVGIVFLHSYIQPAHEQQCAQALREALPAVTVCASHEISKLWREYERSNTVAMSAYVQPIIQRYFARLQKEIDDKGLVCPFYAMQSNGGIASFENAVRSPLTLVESGPAGGVSGATRIGAALGELDILYLDVGGTTAKCSLIQGGNPALNVNHKLEHSRINPGYPVQVPVVDIVEIGAGGGSIAWIDARGALNMGPESAGSMPGPACYGLGGTKPSLTDALLVIGVLDADSFADGNLKLHPKEGYRAIATLAEALGVSVEESAIAIIDIAAGNMINALKLVSVQRGHDPRSISLLVSGGAGPTLACRLGRELGSKQVVIPPHPGIFSAWGMLAAKPRADFSRSCFAEMCVAGVANVQGQFEQMKAEAKSYLSTEADMPVQYSYRIEARYRGQEHSVKLEFVLGEGVAELSERFHAAHEKSYTFQLNDLVIEITGVHLEAVLETSVIALPQLDTSTRTVASARQGSRAVYFGAHSGWLMCNVYSRILLPANQPILGPLIVEEPTSFTLVLPEQVLMMTDVGVLLIQEHQQ